MRKSPLFCFLIIILLLTSQALAANAKPIARSIKPSSGSSVADKQVIFTTTYSDSNGWQDIKSAWVIINTCAAYPNSVAMRYDRKINKLYLINSTGTGWLGGITPGTDTVIENKFAKLNCKLTTVSGSLNTLVIKWALAFKVKFSSAVKRNFYLSVKDAPGLFSGWANEGTWIVTKPAVKRSGIKFVFDGKNYYFAGLNTYYLMVYTAWQHNFADEIYDDMQALGAKVMRTWAFCDGSQWNTLQIRPGVYNEDTFKALDYVIAEAAKHNVN